MEQKKKIADLDEEYIVRFEDIKTKKRKYNNLKFLGVHENPKIVSNTKQICCLIANPSNKKAVSKGRQLILYPKSKNKNNKKEIQYISQTHPLAMPTSYPLLFPYGYSQWNVWDREKISATRFYRFKLQEFKNIENCHLLCDRLTQQYMIDCWLAAEADKLNYIASDHVQKALKKAYEINEEKKESLIDSNPTEIVDFDDEITVLPSSYVGSPRERQQYYRDACAISAKYTKPAWFITMTCNGEWPEIKNALKPGQTYLSRPDLCCRVFKKKFDEFLHDIRVKQIFGKHLASVYSIEFQHGGLPHGHICVIIEHKDVPHTAAEIDNIISAELPDITKDKELYDLVIKFMSHPPCSKALSKTSKYKQYSCRMKNINFCDSGFPKKYVAMTRLNEDGYPIIRRRSPLDEGDFKGNIHTTNKGRIITNADVVCYNAYTLKKYKCHLNVLLCYSINSYKYIFYYIHKGFTKTTISVRKNNIHNDIEGKIKLLKMMKTWI